MNILIPDSWLRQYLDTPATPRDIQRCLSLCGPSIERLRQTSTESMNWFQNQDIQAAPINTKRGQQPSFETDCIYDIEVTTNRPDCMSVLGISREAAAILPQFGFTAKLNSPHLTQLKTETSAELEIKNDPRLNSRILAVVVSGVSTVPSPQWLADRLIQVGLRPLNLLVDITNYVMWEIGHPIHVFDYDRLTSHRMQIRLARKGESLTTLDHKTHSLLGGEVVIDDGTGIVIDLPCIMGAENSVVTDKTTTCLFFIEDIDPVRVRRASMSLGIRTAAAVLKEKDIDPELGKTAMQRAIALVSELLPASRPQGLIDIYPTPAKAASITISLDRINRTIGIPMEKDTVADILNRLGFSVKLSQGSFTVTPPSWRAKDVTIPEDIVEEIARIYGYHNIPPVALSGRIPDPDYNHTFYWEDRIKLQLKFLGFTETYTYSLVEKDSGLKLANPLSQEWVFLRTSLFPSHKQVIQENLGRVEHLDLFEIANVYLPRPGDLPVEESRLVISTTNPDYSRLKGAVESLFSQLHIHETPAPIASDSGILYWEVPLAPLIAQAKTTTTYTPISKFSPIVEHFNVAIASGQTYAQLISKLQKISPNIKSIDLLEKYGSKLTLKITFHSDSRQLTTEDIAPVRAKITSL